MNDILFGAGVIVVWLVLQFIVFPKLGMRS